MKILEFEEWSVESGVMGAINSTLHTPNSKLTFAVYYSYLISFTTPANDSAVAPSPSSLSEPF